MRLIEFKWYDTEGEINGGLWPNALITVVRPAMKYKWFGLFSKQVGVEQATFHGKNSTYNHYPTGESATYGECSQLRDIYQKQLFLLKREREKGNVKCVNIPSN